jgi:hypothetical protein
MKRDKLRSVRIKTNMASLSQGMKKGEAVAPPPKKAKGPRSEMHKLSFGGEEVGEFAGVGIFDW